MMIVLIMFEIRISDYSLAVIIRNKTQQLIAPFASQNHIFQSEELRLLLTSVFGFRQYEVSYELLKILCFGKNQYISITPQELIDYLMEKYLGENAINKYSYQKGYARKEEKVMNKDQFLQTLSLGLSYIPQFQINDYADIFREFFDQIDQAKQGTITQLQYFHFLKYFFGSESPMSVNPTKRVVQISESRQIISNPSEKQLQFEASPIKPAEKIIKPIQNYLSNKQITAQSISNQSLKTSALDDFHDLIIKQITLSCREYDSDDDGKLSKRQVEKYLYNVLELEEVSIQFIIGQYFNFVKLNSVLYTEFIEIVCEVHFREILTSIIRADRKIQNTNQIFMNKQYFCLKISENCYFFRNKPSKQLLGKAFQELAIKSGQNDTITLEDFRSFVLVYCCNNKLIFRSQPRKSTHTLTVPPASIMEVQNSNYEEDESDNADIKQRSADHTVKDLSRDHSFDSYTRRRSNRTSEKKNIYTTGEVLEEYGTKKSLNLITIQRQKQSPQELIKSEPNLKEEKSEEIDLSRRSFKEILWIEFSKRISLYNSQRKQSISKSQLINLISNDSLFSTDKSSIESKLLKYFVKENFIKIQSLISFLIHFKGQKSLIEFSSKQIKGKSTLNETQIAQILYEAYGKCFNLSEGLFYDFSNNLLIQNGKKIFLYKNYLELIARNLSIRNNF